MGFCSPKLFTGSKFEQRWELDPFLISIKCVEQVLKFNQ